VIHLHNAHHFAPELAIAFFQQGHAKRLINSVHDRIGEHLYVHVLNFDWQFTLFASDYLRTHLPTPQHPNLTLPLGIDLSAFTPSGSRDPRIDYLERPVIFHPARLLRWKGVTTSVEAFIRLRTEVGTGSLVLCKSTNIVDDALEVKALRSDLTRIARSGNVQDSVHYLEFHRIEMPLAYRASDLVWYPTIDEEAFGLVPIEAMACGIPLIVSNSGAMVETVYPEEAGLIVPKADPDALANASSRILRDPSLRETLRSGGQRRSRAFDILSYVEALERIYHSIL
jgi:glycosyltransferase involved in cell wall biosynthesis